MPVFQVEFHTFHEVFHILISTGSEPCIHFVIFKSELWQIFGSTFFDFLRTICRIQVGNMTIFWTASCPLLPNCPISFWRMQSSVENRPLLSLSRSSAQMLLSLVKMLHFTRFSIFRLRFRPRKLRFDYKNSLVDWFYPLFGVYLGCNFVKPYTKCCVGTKRPR